MFIELSIGYVRRVTIHSTKDIRIRWLAKVEKSDSEYNDSNLTIPGSRLGVTN